MCFVFVSCGAICSLIDKVFYGGSLDFIGISNLFIADIKDLYINLGILFLLLLCLTMAIYHPVKIRLLKMTSKHWKSFYYL